MGETGHAKVGLVQFAPPLPAMPTTSRGPSYGATVLTTARSSTRGPIPTVPRQLAAWTLLTPAPHALHPLLAVALLMLPAPPPPPPPPPPPLRAFKNVEATLTELQCPAALTGPRVMTRATSGAWLALRSEVVALHETRRNLANRLNADDRAVRRPEKRRR
mgnify:CR=1 FL=1